MYENYNSLGFFSNYFSRNEKIITYKTFEDAVTNLHQKIIDPVTFLEIFSKGYCFANRTLVKDLYRTPWMAKPSSDNSDWEYFKLPKHDKNKFSENEIAEKFYNLLEEEMYSFCSEKKNIGVLLSGGMDSRISAGILQNLLNKGNLNAKVTAITWGIENSRDIIYAEQIAKRFQWEWRHINLTAKNLLDNLDYCSEIGCEVSPIHLHAMPVVQNLNGLDCIIASSFGDSIGRGVFSSRHISNLKNISEYLFNWFYLLKNRPYRKYKEIAKNDLELYRNNYARSEIYQILEIEQLSIYMRRMLNTCIGIINQKIPTYQTFATPNVYEFIWSIDKSLRNDSIYAYIIKNYLKELSDIPWSKTGKRYNTTEGTSDAYLKEYHMYHKWINEDIFDNLFANLNSYNIDKLYFLNKKSLEKAILANRKIITNRVTRVDQVFTWLVSVIKMMQKFDIQTNETNFKQSVRDEIQSHFVTPYVMLLEKIIDFKKK